MGVILEKVSCHTCVHFEALIGPAPEVWINPAPYGECRINPPVIDFTTEMCYHARFPIVAAIWYCGKWQDQKGRS